MSSASASEAWRAGAPRPAVRAVPDVAAEIRRLTHRDWWLLDLLNEHQVLTTEHIAALAYDHPRTANHNRLALLAHRGVLARFRRYQRPGSASYRWTVGPLGAAVLAARDGSARPRPASVNERINRLAASPRLDHLLGVNGLFVALAAHARLTPGAELVSWSSERACAAATGGLARPDAGGVWADNGRTVAFWLEYDTGTEATHRVAAKLEDYRRLQRAAGNPQRVLFWLSSAGRERSLQNRLTRHPAVAAGLAVATATGGHPAGPIWLPPPGTTRVAVSRTFPDGPTSERQPNRSAGRDVPGTGRRQRAGPSRSKW